MRHECALILHCITLLVHYWYVEINTLILTHQSCVVVTYQTNGVLCVNFLPREVQLRTHSGEGRGLSLWLYTSAA